MSETKAEHPILFSGPMVKAILEDRKTMTRRVIKNPGRFEGLMLDGEAGEWCPYGNVGQRLWVREQWTLSDYSTAAKDRDAVWYRADKAGAIFDCEHRKLKGQPRLALKDDLNAIIWTPAIYMPRWASRITLEITDVQVERLQDISEQDIAAEGLAVTPGTPCATAFVDLPRDKRIHSTATACFAAGWNALNTKHGWKQNPFVWVISFKRIKVKG